MLGRDLVDVLPHFFPSDEISGWDLDEIDLCDEKSTLEKIESLGPKVVIHLAAYTDVDGCESNAAKAFRVNADGTKHLALGAERSGAKVVYLSTDYVFDGEKGEPYLEEDPPHPLNVYGHSKLKGEEYLKALVKDHLIIRAQWLYGKHGKNFVDTVLQKAKKEKVLSVVDDQIGAPTYTVDLSRAISNLLGCDARGAFHVANDASCSWYAFARTIVELSGISGVKIVPISSKELGRPAKRPRYSVFNCQKFRGKTGTALRPWADALGDYLKRSG
jgi:dTDP-4-dehydrorhamnose reductase